LTLVLLMTRLVWCAGTETERDFMQTMPVEEETFAEEDILSGEDAEPENENCAGPQVLAGPVELNTYFEGLIIDETAGREKDPAADALPDALADTGTEAEVFTGKEAGMAAEPEDGAGSGPEDGAGSGPEGVADSDLESGVFSGQEEGVFSGQEEGAFSGEGAGQNPEGVSEILTQETDRGEKREEQTEEGYTYEKSMPLSELALLPPLVAGAATEVGRGNRKLMRGASSAQTALWACSDYYVGEPDLYAVTKKDDFSLKYQIEFHTSTGLDPGSVQIRVPESLLTDRNQRAIIPSQIGIPKGTLQSPVQSLNSPFNWYQDDTDNSLVFFNYREIASGTNSAFQILYHPVRILDLADASAWSLTPSIQVRLRD